MMRVTDHEIGPETIDAAIGSDRVMGALAGWNRLSGGTAPEDDMLDGFIVLAVASGKAASIRDIQAFYRGAPDNT